MCLNLKCENSKLLIEMSNLYIVVLSEQIVVKNVLGHFIHRHKKINMFASREVFESFNCSTTFKVQIDTWFK